jgi:hypothetical protein
VVDAIDIVTNCETVDKAGAAAGPGGPAGDPRNGGATLAFTTKAVGKKQFSVTIPCAGACKVSATLTAKGKKLATAKKTKLKAGNAKLTLKFKKPSKNVKASLKVTLEAADGTKTTSSKSVKLKR